MPQVTITNNSLNESAVSNPPSETFITLPPSTATSFIVNDITLEQMEPQLVELTQKVDTNGNPLFDVAVSASAAELAGAEFAGSGAMARYLANRVSFGLAVANGTTPTVFNARRVNIAVGEAMVDGAHFVLSAPVADEVGDFEINVAGADLSAVDLTGVSNSTTSVVLCRESNDPANTVQYANIVTVLVRGPEVLNATSEGYLPLTDLEIATALSNGIYADLEPYFGFTRIADVYIKLDPTTTVNTFTVTDRRDAPPGY